MGRSRRAEAPVAKVDFVNFVPQGTNVETASPQPANHARVAEGALDLDGTVLLNTRALVDEALKNPGVFSSEDLVEQGNTLPLIPLNIDPPDHVKYRRLLDPLVAPRRIDALEADIADRVTHFVDAFVQRGSCDFTAEFAELFPSSVFLGLMGLPEDELRMFLRLRDGILHGEKFEGEARADVARRTGASSWRSPN